MIKKILLLILLCVNSLLISMDNGHCVERPLWQRVIVSLAWSNHLDTYACIAGGINQKRFIETSHCKMLGIEISLGLACKKLIHNPASSLGNYLISFIQEAEKNKYLPEKTFTRIIGTYKNYLYERIMEGNTRLAALFAPLFMRNEKSIKTCSTDTFVIAYYLKSYPKLKKEGKEYLMLKIVHDASRLHDINILQQKIDDEGLTALHIAALELPDCLETLLHCATLEDLATKDKQNATPLFRAQMQLATYTSDSSASLRDNLRRSITLLKNAEKRLRTHP